jgi:nucleoside-diphosphate-sugar epimerase
VRQVVVTGAGGYIGSVLVPALLEAGYRVTAVDRFLFGRETLAPRAGLTIREEDIREVDTALFEGQEAVIDLAALSNDPAGELDPDRTWAINHRARVRVARLAKAAGVRRYILPSSCSVYGFQEGILTEESPVNPLTTYAKANLQAERDVLPLASGEFCVVVLRLATVYGYSPRMRFDLAVNGMVRGLVKHGKIPILRDGTQWRPFVHVGDVAAAMVRMLEAPAGRVNGQVINVGSDDQNVQILPLARAVAEAVGVPFVYEWYGAPDHRSYRVSFRKLGDVAGWRPQRTPAEGAREVYGALREGKVDPDDPRTITVGWYKHLVEKGVRL